jgi:hypothetical protein
MYTELHNLKYIDTPIKINTHDMFGVIPLLVRTDLNRSSRRGEIRTAYKKRLKMDTRTTFY